MDISNSYQSLRAKLSRHKVVSRKETKWGQHREVINLWKAEKYAEWRWTRGGIFKCTWKPLELCSSITMIAGDGISKCRAQLSGVLITVAQGVKLLHPAGSTLREIIKARADNVKRLQKRQAWYCQPCMPYRVLNSAKQHPTLTTQTLKSLCVQRKIQKQKSHKAPY